MKKIIIFLSLICFGYALEAQDRTVPFNIPADKSQVYYDGWTVANGKSQNLDRVSLTKDSLAFLISIKRFSPTQYDVKLRLDTISASKVTVKFQGRKFTTDSWTDITTVTYAGTVDTSIYFSLNTDPTWTEAGTRTIVYDTTAIMNHASPSLKALYTGAETGTMTMTATAYMKFYKEYRVLMIRTAGTTDVEYFEFNLFER